MTEEEKREKKHKIFEKILCDSIKEEEAISEYMKLGDSYEDAKNGYFYARSEAIKSQNRWL